MKVWEFDEDKIQSCEQLLSDYGYSIKPPRRYTERMACIALSAREKSLAERKLAFLQCHDIDDSKSSCRFALLRTLNEQLRRMLDEPIPKTQELKIRKDIFRLKLSLSKDGYNPEFDINE